MAHHDRRLARRAGAQALGVVLVVLAGTAAVAWQVRQPADQDEVAIGVGAVRSHSAELALLAEDGGRKLPPRFAQAHAGQLQKSVDRTADEIASLNAQPPLDAPLKALQAPLRQVKGEVQAVQRAGLPALAASATAARQRTDRLEQAEQALQR